MSIDGPDYSSSQGRTHCRHGVDVAAWCTRCPREAEMAGDVDSDRVTVLPPRRGHRDWLLDTADGRGCMLAVVAMLAVVYVPVLIALVWL